MERSFEINCNTSFNPPRAFLSILGGEIMGINPTNVRVNMPNLALSTYGQGARILTVVYGLSTTRYTFSDQNWLTAIGCDDMAAVTGLANRSFSGGCVSYCQSAGDSGGVASCPNDSNGFGLGTGCCRTPIPKGTTNLFVNLTDVHRNWRNNKLFSTSYAFVGEMVTSNFSYRLNDLNNATIFLSDNWSAKNTPPVVLDWKIGQQNCDEARRNLTTYACKANSECVNFDTNIVGYLCNCSKGYQGNPYLDPGCQDSDECADNPCDPNADCTNIPGSFICKCRKSYGGDGMKGGSGCTKLPPSTIINVSIGVGAGVGFIMLLAICFYVYKAKQKRNKRIEKEKFFEHLLLQHQTNEGTLERTKLFPAKELEKATDNFNASRILGQGGQGTVYKGMLSDGKIVAIKKLKLVDEDQLEQLINEVVILSQINHRNVVKLLGCCLATEVPLLVYEFVSHGTLFDLIHDRNAEISLSWEMRLKMAADIAGALAYLHSASSVPIFHRDIKSSNILLDEKYVVKVSDFGTSKVVAVDQTHLTTLVKGTFGYLDPEYFQTSQFTDKSDVYSFGVVLVELLTGRRPISPDTREGDRNLATRFLASLEAGDLKSILDGRVSEEGGREEVGSVARLAERCLNHKGKMRPSMREVAIELESIRMSQMPSTARGEEGVEISGCEVKPMMITDIDYTWASGKTEISSPSDTRPFISDIV
ncbi:wall-associated receptor kinase-like 2 [Salvia splendens]|uniref:wall-associated receptor kinase-like 2 n=1 Tax=Salvia splendens TaxID=180675 RepID=UPI001C27E0B5|nr:wall-associated receptor kinase-like 2 [Salvia splendens]